MQEQSDNTYLSPFGTSGIWIESLLTQLKGAVGRNDTEVYKSIEEILKSLGVSDHQIGQAKLDGALIYEKYSKEFMQGVQQQIDNCQCGLHH